MPNGFAAVRAQAPVSMKRFFDYVQSTCVLGKMEEHGTARLEIYLNHATNRRFGLQRITPWMIFLGHLIGLTATRRWPTKILQSSRVPDPWRTIHVCRLLACLLQGEVLKKRNKKTIKKEESLKKAIRKKHTVSFMDHIVAISMVLQNKWPEFCITFWFML